MSGTSERLRYDTDTYRTDLNQSVRPMNWTLDPVRNNQPTLCFPEDPFYRSTQGVSLKANESLIDTESDLRLLNLRASRDPQKKYLPKCTDNKNCEPCRKGYPCGNGDVLQDKCKQCQDPLIDFKVCNRPTTDQTRLSNPQCTMRSTGINRFNPLYLNNQDETKWLVQGEVGISSRSVARDNHFPCIPRVMTVDLTQPTGDAMPHRYI